MPATTPICLTWVIQRAIEGPAERSHKEFVRTRCAYERALHALEVAHAVIFEPGGPSFQSPRYGVEYKTEKVPRVVFTEILKQLGIRHRRAYKTRHTYATMLLMAGVNLRFVANQLGHSPTMTATVYAKWISGEADRKEIEELDTCADVFLPMADAARAATDAGLAPAQQREAKILRFSRGKLVGTAGFEPGRCRNQCTQA